MADEVYYSKELIELAKKNFHMSPSTWHKIMHPYCAQCAIERMAEKMHLQMKKEGFYGR